MKKGRLIRIPVNFDANIVFEDKQYKVVIENLSDGGVQIRTYPLKNKLDFTPGLTVNLELQIPSGEVMNLPSEEIKDLYSGKTLSLHCRVKWSVDTPPEGLSKSVGLEIIGKSAAYDEFLKTLHISYMNIL